MYQTSEWSSDSVATLPQAHKDGAPDIAQRFEVESSLAFDSSFEVRAASYF